MQLSMMSVSYMVLLNKTLACGNFCFYIRFRLSFDSVSQIPIRQFLTLVSTFCIQQLIQRCCRWQRNHVRQHYFCAYHIDFDPATKQVVVLLITNIQFDNVLFVIFSLNNYFVQFEILHIVYSQPNAIMRVIVIRLHELHEFATNIEGAIAKGFCEQLLMFENG